jgi:hypothetical protein
MKLDIWVVDHRGIDRSDGHNEAADPQPEGDIIKVWNVREHHSSFDERYYADWGAFYDVSQHYLAPPDYVGFFGYRKYLWMPRWFHAFDPPPHCDHAPGWVHVSKIHFDIYRFWLSKWDGEPIKEMLKQYDIIQSAPYYYETDGVEDFRRHSGSRADGFALEEVTRRHGWYNPDVYQNWPNFLMITHWPIYTQMVADITPLMLELNERRSGEGSSGYLARPMIYMLERLYPLWLTKSKYNFLEVPLLHCREMGPKAPGW